MCISTLHIETFVGTSSYHIRTHISVAFGPFIVHIRITVNVCGMNVWEMPGWLHVWSSTVQQEC